jgi:YggT family protein
MLLALASARHAIAGYVNALFEVYIILIFVYILVNMIFSLGVRPPYARWSDLVLRFLRDVCEPYLRLFRRFIPAVGMFDFSPIVAIFVLWILDRVFVPLIDG